MKSIPKIIMIITSFLLMILVLNISPIDIDCSNEFDQRFDQNHAKHDLSETIFESAVNKCVLVSQHATHNLPNGHHLVKHIEIDTEILSIENHSSCFLFASELNDRFISNAFALVSLDVIPLPPSQSNS